MTNVVQYKNKFSLSRWEASAASIHVDLNTVIQISNNNPFNACLNAGIESKFDRHWEKPNFKYHPSWVVAVPVTDTYCPAFVSTPSTKKNSGEHAEIKLIQFYKEIGKLQELSHILISYSPCSKCTQVIIEAFQHQTVKPSIQFHCLYSHHEAAKEDLIKLMSAGFQIGAWDYKPFASFLIDTAPTKSDTEKLRRSLEINEEGLNVKMTDTNYICKSLSAVSMPQVKLQPELRSSRC